MAYDENALREGLRKRGLLPNATLGGTRLKRVPDNDDDPSNDRFSAYVVDADGGVGREADLSRQEANYLQATQPDAQVLPDEEPLVGPEQEEYLARAGNQGVSARAQALRQLSAGEVADLEAQNASFQQGLRLKGKPTPKSTGGARFPVDYAKAGQAETPAGFAALVDIAPRRRMDAEGIAVAPSSPTSGDRAPASAEPYDAEFAAAQAAARSRRMDAILGRAGDEIATAISGVGSVDNAYWDALRGEADSSVKELLAQREANKKKGLSDPTSPQSKRLQGAVAKALPGVYSPEELAAITAADEDVVLKYDEMRARLDERREAQKLAAQQRRDDIAREDRRTADQRAWEEKQAGASRSFQAGENAKNRAAQRELAGLNNAADIEQARLRGLVGPDGQPMARGTVVPGLEIAPGAAPTAADATVVKKSEAARGRMTQLASELKALHAKYGTELVGENARRMEQLSTAMELEAKTLAELGALTGPDLDLVRSLTGVNPTGVGANLKALVGMDNTQQALEGVTKWSNDMANATRETYGYRPAGGGKQSGTGAGQEMVPMLDPQGRQRMVPRSKVQAAIAAGGRLAP